MSESKCQKAKVTCKAKATQDANVKMQKFGSRGQKCKSLGSKSYVTLELAHNTSLNRVTGYSPFMLTFFQNPRTPFSDPDDNLRTSYGSGSDDLFRNQLIKIKELAKETHQQYQTYTKSNYDKNILAIPPPQQGLH